MGTNVRVLSLAAVFAVAACSVKEEAPKEAADTAGAAATSVSTELSVN
ncbi:MAG: hypothetical protein ABI681_02445 [Gemmatimonadales bacterium]